MMAFNVTLLHEAAAAAFTGWLISPFGVPRGFEMKCIRGILAIQMVARMGK